MTGNKVLLDTNIISAWLKGDSAIITKIISRYDLLKVDENTALEYGGIKAALRKKGRPIPENDIWIAAIARQYDLTLVTRDKHFLEIENLAIQSW